MTITEIKQEIIEFLAQQSSGMTARQISTEMMLEDDHKRVTQALSMLKKEGFIYGEVHYSDIEDAQRVHYSIDQTCKELAEELGGPKNEPKTATEEDFQIIDEAIEEVKEIPIKTLDNSEFELNYGGERNLITGHSEAVKAAEQITINTGHSVEIYAIKRTKLGTYQPVTKAEFKAA